MPVDPACPRGLMRVSQRAYAIADVLRCKECDGFHVEDRDAELAEMKRQHEEVEADQVETLARQMLIEMADIEPDLPLRNARNICRNLAQWAFKNGCRP